MLWNASDVVGYHIEAADGAIGGVKDLLFDDRGSVIRYVVVDTGEWLPGRKVLLAPAALGEADPARRAFPTALRRAQIEDSPSIAEDQPVSRQEEEQLHLHYGWAPYWAAPEAATLAPYWGAAGYEFPYPMTEADAEREAMAETEPGPGEPRGDPHLRSANEVIGYYIEAADGDIGHVEDLLVEDGSWMIRWIVVDTRNWLPGRKVIVSPRWLRSIDWAARKLALDLSRERIRSSPEYDPTSPLDRRLEQAIHEHYERPTYWGQGT